MAFFKAILLTLAWSSPFLVSASYSFAAAEERCGNRWVTTDVDARAEGFSTNAICERASWAIAQMNRCGFSVEQTLTVEVVDDLRHPCGGIPVVGHFDSIEFKVQVASPNQCRQLFREEAELAKLDFNALYGSIVVHEVIHAVLWRQLGHSKNGQVSAMATEYIAYAFQILSLPEADRDRLLEAFPGLAPRDLSPFNYFALLLNPLRFAANAYRHLMSVDERCQFLGEIISGEVEFDDWDQYE